MDIRKVKKLIELLDESGIAEIEITEGEESVRISRYSQNAPPGSRRCTNCSRRSDSSRVGGSCGSCASGAGSRR